jgi:hypothetical protein
MESLTPESNAIGSEREPRSGPSPARSSAVASAALAVLALSVGVTIGEVLSTAEQARHAEVAGLTGIGPQTSGTGLRTGKGESWVEPAVSSQQRWFELQQQWFELPALRAEGSKSEDMDGDGLSAVMELILLTSDGDSDTDGDGFIDPLEVSFGSDPSQAASRPEGALFGAIGMCAHASDGMLNLVTAIYVPNGTLPSIKFEMGVRVAGLMIPLPPDVYNVGAALVEVPINGTPDKVFVFQTPLPVYPLQVFGTASIYTTIAANFLGAPVIAASALNLLSTEGTVLQLLAVPSQSAASSSSTSGAGPSMYRPLSSPGGVPPSWTSGQICVQQTQTVGSSGAVEVQQVVSASCQPYDGYCPASCPNLVGTTIEVVNPLGLIGGS